MKKKDFSITYKQTKNVTKIISNWRYEHNAHTMTVQKLLFISCILHPIDVNSHI